jgi:Ferritin-like domain
MMLQFLSHEREHVMALESQLGARGHTPATSISTPAQANAVLSQHGLSIDIGKVRTFKDAIKLLYDIEGLSQGAYYAAVGLLSASGPLVPAAEALSCEAQHQALLTGLLYPGEIERSVPGAFVEGWQ